MIVQNNSSELNVCELDLYELTVCDYLKWVYVPMIDSQLMEITVGYPMYPDTQQYSSLIAARDVYQASLKCEENSPELMNLRLVAIVLYLQHREAEISLDEKYMNWLRHFVSLAKSYVFLSQKLNVLRQAMYGSGSAS